MSDPKAPDLAITLPADQWSYVIHCIEQAGTIRQGMPIIHAIQAQGNAALANMRALGPDIGGDEAPEEVE